MEIGGTAIGLDFIGKSNATIGVITRNLVGFIYKLTTKSLFGYGSKDFRGGSGQDVLFSPIFMRIKMVFGSYSIQNYLIRKSIYSLSSKIIQGSG